MTMEGGRGGQKVRCVLKNVGSGCNASLRVRHRELFCFPSDFILFAWSESSELCKLLSLNSSPKDVAVRLERESYGFVDFAGSTEGRRRAGEDSVRLCGSIDWDD